VTEVPSLSRIAVIIPVLGDTRELNALFGQLRQMRCSPAEIIVVDGANDPQLRELCRRWGATWLGSRPGRGHQLHSGALAAQAELLWFLHADAAPPADGADAIRVAVAGGAIGGYFQFRFAGARRWYKAMIAALINLRCRIGVPYGDQGLFVTRSAYLAAGGFPDAPLFEEVPLVKALRRMGRFVALANHIGVSPRRWERDGWLRRTLENRALALRYMLGTPPAQLAQRYRLIRPAAVPPHGSATDSGQQGPRS
jgi:rSAM/selenodomain-associated transferase 2